MVANRERGGWDTKRSNAEHASKHFETKADAMDYAKKHALNIGAELIPHKKDGTIQNPNSYGGDHCPPKDKKH